MNIASLFVRLMADVSDLDRKMKQAQKSLSTTGAAMKDLGRSLSVGVTAPLALLGGLTVRSAAQLDSLRRGLTAVTGSADEAERQLTRLADVAKLPGLGFREAIQGSIRLQAAGFSAQLAEDALRGFGNALATVGSGAAELDQVTRALSQIASKGKISAEEINQLAEVVPQIRRVMQDAFGTSNGELLQKAGIDAESFVRKVTDSLLKLEQATGGPANSFENLRDSLFRASAAIGEKLLPAVIPLVEGLATLASKARELDGNTVRLGIALAAAAALIGPLITAVVGLTQAYAALKIAGLAAATVLGVGGVVAIALAGLSALFIKNKLDALEASSAAEDYKNSLRGLSLELARLKLDDVLAEGRVLAADLAATPATTRRESFSLGAGGSIETTVANPAFAEAKAALDANGEQFRILVRRIGELQNAQAAGLEGGATSIVDTGALDAAADALADQLAAAAGKTKDIRAAFARAADDLEAANFGKLADSSKGLKAAMEKAADDLAAVNAGKFQTEFIQGAKDRKAAPPPTLDPTLLQAFEAQITGLAASFGPMAIAAAVLAPVMEGLAPVFEILREPLRVLGQLIGVVITPLFERMAVPLKLVIKAYSFFVEAMGNVILAIGKAIDAIPGISGGPIIRAGREMIAGAKTARAALDGVAEAADKLKDTMTTNLPQGFRTLSLQLAQFASSTPVPSRSAQLAPGRSAVSVQDNRVATIQVIESATGDGTFKRRVVEVIRATFREDGLIFSGDPSAFLPALAGG